MGKMGFYWKRLILAALLKHLWRPMGPSHAAKWKIYLTIFEGNLKHSHELHHQKGFNYLFEKQVCNGREDGHCKFFDSKDRLGGLSLQCVRITVNTP